MTDFVMPSLGADMESGKVVEWLVKPGSEVKKGDVVAVVETHKGAIEVEIFEEGVDFRAVRQGRRRSPGRKAPASMVRSRWPMWRPPHHQRQPRSPPQNRAGRRAASTRPRCVTPSPPP
jgi:pyruvate dehydrogenase E2 component (dihydrolipoamide acetyltransferase)